MASDTVTVLCGKCKVSVEGPTNPKSQDIFSCPSCGRNDRFDNVMTSVQAHVTEVAAKKLQDSLKSGLRGSKFVKVTGKPVKQGSHRFISNLKL